MILRLRPCSIMLVKAEEFSHVHLCDSRTVCDFQKILVVVIERISAEVCGARVDDWVVALCVNDDELVMNAHHDLGVLMRPRHALGHKPGRGIFCVECAKTDDVMAL